MLNAALAPQALALHQLVNAESARFPQLARAVAGDAGNRRPSISSPICWPESSPNRRREDREFAAAQFIFMVVTIPRRRAMGYGTPMTAAEVEPGPAKVVRLFLDGCRGMKR